MAETTLQKFKTLLAELFMFDHAELDFGIYRIMNAKRQEITRFLDQDLLPQVRTSLAELGTADRAGLEGELAKAIEQAKAVGIDPETAPKVKDLRVQLAATADLAALENEVFSDLYDFFRRYYHEGDFLSLRRYKAGVYAIPYEGEEVKLHWANADQYYIKSTEYFRDYAFRLPSGRRVHFKLAEADTEKDNTKAAADKDRRFMLAGETPVAEEAGELVIRFVYQPDPEKRKQAAINDATLEAVLGARETADALVRAAPAAFDAWIVELAAPAPTEADPDRTILEKHLTDYTARNTFDYFIHKDLGGFLRRELDFYVKNEVMHLDDVEDEAAPRVEAYLAKIKAIRRIAHKIIDLLAQLEDFQKRLWLKKKFVVETQYCVTLDRVPEALYPEIAASEAQREEWVRLFAINEITGDMHTPGYAAPLNVEFLKANPFLVLDTRFFGQVFKDTLLAALDDVEEGIDGLVIHSENFQALCLLQSCYRDAVKCIYIDPPYNTDAGPIVYKNGYRSSTWMTLMENRLCVSRLLLADDGVMCVTIDDYQVHELAHLMNSIFDRSNQLGVVVIRSNPSGRSTVRGLSICHEYAFFYRNTEAATLERFPRTEKQLKRFTQEEGAVVAWRNFRKDGGMVTHRAERPRQFYPIYVKLPEKTLRVPELSWDKEQREWHVLEQPQEGESVVLPLDEKDKERVWSYNHLSARDNLADLEVRIAQDGSLQIFRRHTPSDGVLPRSLWDKNTYAAREYGSAALADLFGASSAFSFAKSPFAVQDSVWVAGLNHDSDDYVLDFFAGSGTTAHAVVNLNREDNGRRRYILAEMGNYFDTVLKPRIQKVVYSKDWKDGKPESRDSGVSHMFKYIRLESYEDALNNLVPTRTPEQADLLAGNTAMREDYMLRYMLDVETRGSPSLLNVQRFEDPFNYTLQIAAGSVGETRPVKVDLVETFNYLLGLRVRHVDVIRGFRVVTGTSPQGDKVLVIWRCVRENPNAALDEFFLKQGYNTRDMEFDLVYVNGDNNLENLKRPDDTWKVRLIEEEFQRLMFDVKDV